MDIYKSANIFTKHPPYACMDNENVLGKASPDGGVWKGQDITELTQDNELLDFLKVCAFPVPYCGSRRKPLPDETFKEIVEDLDDTIAVGANHYYIQTSLGVYKVEVKPGSDSGCDFYVTAYDRKALEKYKCESEYAKYDFFKRWALKIIREADDGILSPEAAIGKLGDLSKEILLYQSAYFALVGKNLNKNVDLREDVYESSHNIGLFDIIDAELIHNLKLNDKELYDIVADDPYC